MLASLDRPLFLGAAAIALLGGAVIVEAPQNALPVGLLAASALLTLRLTLAGEALRRDTMRVRREAEAVVDEVHEATDYANATASLSRLAQSDRKLLEVATEAAGTMAGVLKLDWVGLIARDADGPGLRELWRAPGVAPELVLLASTSARPRLRYLESAMEGEHATFMDASGKLSRDLWDFAEAGARSLAIVPLHGDASHPLAFFAVRTSRAGNWSPKEQELLKLAARSVSLSRERRHRLHRLREESLSDALTGLGNRRAFEADLVTEMARSARSSTVLSVIVMDLDGLKAVNDKRGHDAGDLLLKEFATALRAHFRAEDRLYRLGGDEYSAILPLVGQDPGAVLARLRAAIDDVKAAGFPEADVSAGVAAFPRDSRTSAGLVRVADERMYAMKRDHHRARGITDDPRVPQDLDFRLMLELDSAPIIVDDLPSASRESDIIIKV
jgi:two-component system cell cycle response regulator